MSRSRATAAARGEDWRRDAGGLHKAVESLGRSERFGAECGREFDARALAGFRMVDGSLVNRDAEHFLEAEGLGAKLGMVVVPSGFFSGLVFHGADLRDRATILAHLDKVGPAVEAEVVGPHGQGAEELPTGAVPVARQVGVFMVHIAPGGVCVCGAQAVDGFQCRPARAVKKVVEERKGERFVH